MDIFLLVGLVVIIAVVFFKRKNTKKTPEIPTGLDGNISVGGSGDAHSEERNRLIEKSDTF